MQRPCPSGRSAGTSDCRSGEWYPSNIAPSVPRAISWQELCDTIDDRFDIAAESRRLKENPENSKRYATNTATRKNIFNNLDAFFLTLRPKSTAPPIMYRKLIKPILFAMNIERAHSTVLFLLRMIGKIPGGRALLRAMYRTEHPSLEREVFGLGFPTRSVWRRVSTATEKRSANFRPWASDSSRSVRSRPNPRPAIPDPASSGCPQTGRSSTVRASTTRGLYKAIAQLRHRHDRLIIGGNIGKNTLTQPSQVAADYLKMFRNLYQYVDYFSINVCCDNCADGSVSHNKAHLMNILQPLFDFRRGQNQYRPILLKISPDLPDPLIDEVTDLMLSTPLDGIVAVNGTFSRKGLETDEETLDEIGSGRLSGALPYAAGHRGSAPHPPTFARSLSDHRRRRPDECRDVKAMLAAGASLVQLHGIYLRRGPPLVKEICRALIDDAASEASASPAPGK